MRVLVVSTWFPYPADNGSRLRIGQLIHALARDHAVTVLAFGRPDRTDDVTPLLNAGARLQIVADPPARPLRAAGLLSPTPRYFSQTRNRAMVAAIQEQAVQHDVIVAMQVRAAYHVVEAATATPWIFEEAELGAALAPVPGQRSGWRRSLTRWKHRRFMAGLIDKASGVTVASRLERDLISLGLRRDRSIAIVPNAVTVPQATAIGASRLPQVIYPGAVTFEANLDAVTWFVTEIWPLVRRRRPALRFLVTGETAGVDISELAAADGVHFTGRLADVDRPLAQSIACVVPLRVGGGTRLKVLHAMASGTPVVSTSKGVEGLALEADRHYLLGDSPAAFAAQIERLLTDPGIAERLAAAARFCVEEHYTWERSTAVLLEEVSRVGTVAATLRRG
jgi:glycosyltransferase involved in cell wall biosynthesis